MQSSSQIVTANKPTPNFLQAGCPSCRQTNNVNALKGNRVCYIVNLVKVFFSGRQVIEFLSVLCCSWRIFIALICDFVPKYLFYLFLVLGCNSTVETIGR